MNDKAIIKLGLQNWIQNGVLGIMIILLGWFGSHLVSELEKHIEKQDQHIESIVNRTEIGEVTNGRQDEKLLVHDRSINALWQHQARKMGDDPVSR